MTDQLTPAQERAAARKHEDAVRTRGGRITEYIHHRRGLRLMAVDRFGHPSVVKVRKVMQEQKP